MIRKAKEKQDQINKMFEEEGLTDTILKMQIELNKKINKNNINISNEEFVQ